MAKIYLRPFCEGLTKGDNIERTQVQFFKYLYFLNRSTPGYIIRKEFQQKKSNYVFKRALKWLYKIILRLENI